MLSLTWTGSCPRVVFLLKHRHLPSPPHNIALTKMHPLLNWDHRLCLPTQIWCPVSPNSHISPPSLIHLLTMSTSTCSTLRATLQRSTWTIPALITPIPSQYLHPTPMLSSSVSNISTYIASPYAIDPNYGHYPTTSPSSFPSTYT